MTTSIQLTNYRVLFDRQSQGFRASSGTALYRDGNLDLVFYYASDGECGVRPHLTRSPDLGRTWSEPQLFGPDLANPSKVNLSIKMVAVTPQGTELASGYHIPQAVRPDHPEDVRWRPCEVIVGRREAGEVAFRWKRHPSGMFLGEGFLEGGLVTRTGRIILEIWGAGTKGANWECGVLISDDDALSWRYRRVGFEADPAIRADPDMPAGYNEQSLFELPDGTIVSIIRGREKLGAVRPDALDESWFFRSVSTDAGESWSKPVPTNLAGTGASMNGIVLRDGSLLLPVRICLHLEATWVRPPKPEFFGLHLARSFDQGLTWQTQEFLQHDPAVKPFDNYYNAMNGQFLPLDGGRWMYLFGHFDHPRDRHRILCFELSE